MLALGKRNLRKIVHGSGFGGGAISVDGTKVLQNKGDSFPDYPPRPFVYIANSATITDAVGGFIDVISIAPYNETNKEFGRV
jgi:hypothetical protein